MKYPIYLIFFSRTMIYCLLLTLLCVFQLRAQTDFCLNLYSKGVSSDGCIMLEWQWLVPPTETYGYTLYQWDSIVGWQSTSTNYDRTIQVLNVYPDIAGSNTLASWMHDPDVGLGKITVMPVSIRDFNSNPVFYLKNTNGEYQYDAIMFGSWDSNNSRDLTPASVTAVRNFLNSGRGVLFGHDTQHYGRNFALLKDKVNLHIDVNNSSFFRGSSRIKVINDGFLLKYPHHIPYNSILDIPCTHTSGQFAKGIVWMNFPNPQQGSCYHAPVYERGGGTNDFYLTTWNNAAMIQTGHSSGQSTPDERKVIANTLWYLSQFTTETTAKVCSAPDLAAPDMPKINRRCNQIDIISKDNGSPYCFYVKAINMVDNSDDCTSNILDIINQSGLKGFYILEDANSTSDPDLSTNFTVFIPAVDNQSVTYNVKNFTNYIYVQAVDFAGNLSTIITLAPNFEEFNCDPLEFDTYAVIICDRVILLNLKKLAEDGFELTGCVWFKNGIEVTETNTIDEFSYAEGADKLLETDPVYYTYCLKTKNYGVWCSTEKIIISRNKALDCPDCEAENSGNLLIYPNPLLSGDLLTLEGVIKGSPVYVYNHLGVCVLSAIATNNIMNLTLDFPQGIYLIRNENKIVKVMIVN